MAEVSFERKIELLKIEIDKLRTEMEQARKSIDEANTLLAEELFLQEAFKEVGVRMRSREDHQLTIKNMRNILGKNEPLVKSLEAFRDKLIQSQQSPANP